MCPHLLKFIDLMLDCRNFLAELGLTVSAKKLVPPSTQVVCLGILVDTVQQSISIPPEKLESIKFTCDQWSSKVTCSKRTFSPS